MKKEKILITGSNGMVGRNLIDCSESRYFDLLTPRKSELNLLDFSEIVEYLDCHKPEFVIHCAGLVGGIQANIDDPVKFLTHNLNIGMNLVTACSKAGVKKILNLGSSCMYPRDYSKPIPESALLAGKLEPTNEGYALAKIITAKLCEYISSENPNLKYKTLVPCNIFGPHDKFCPNNLDSIDIWGDGSARREFMYAGDLAECIWACVKNFDSLPLFMNVGQGEDHSVKTYYETIAKVVGFQGKFVYDLSKPIGMKRKLVDSGQCRHWGWSPKFTLEQGLKLTYEYYLRKIFND